MQERSDCRLATEVGSGRIGSEVDKGSEVGRTMGGVSTRGGDEMDEGVREKGRSK